uniref:AIG1-type G domain-containing protein n=1 Tax=Lepisosteus oculatus TaxID=7918 RepID=W5LW23_LEPOC
QSDHFLNFSTLIERRQPSLYRLSQEQEPTDEQHFQRFTFGRKVEEGNNKVIILLGATGAGKTTLINAMINYILGVQWEDRFRFKLIHEETNRSQAESQTSIVTSYELHNQKGFVVPYSLTVIDTPGFGDTRGLSRDKLITEQVKRFFTSPGSVDHIDAVCFVVQASLARLTSIQQYVFDSILSIFRKDIAENILVTFVDGKDIPVLGGIEAAGLPCRKNQKGKATHFEFNNSSGGLRENGNEEDENKLEKIVWTNNVKQLKRFFQTLEETEGKDLALTKKVLEERERLETAMARLLRLAKLNEMKKIRACLENEQANMEQNKKFETEIEELVPKRKNTKHLSINCNNCLVSCHSGCFLPNLCAVMDDAGFCVICPGNCHYSAHISEMTMWEVSAEEKQRDIKELKDNFVKASSKFMSTKEMLEKIEMDFETIEDQIMQLIRLSSNCLEEIALKPNALSTAAYIELLIRNEEEEARIAELRKMKQHA